MLNCQVSTNLHLEIKYGDCLAKVLLTKSHEYSPLWRITSPFIPSADIFLFLTSFSDRKVSPQEEKSNVLSRQIICDNLDRE